MHLVNLRHLTSCSSQSPTTQHTSTKSSPQLLQTSKLSLDTELDLALDEISVAKRQIVSSRAAAVGETFGCYSPAYGTIHHHIHLHSTLRATSIVEPSSHSARTSFNDLRSPSSEPSLILTFAQHRLPTRQHPTAPHLAFRTNLTAGTRSQEWILSLHTLRPHNRLRPSPRLPHYPSQVELEN